MLPQAGAQSAREHKRRNWPDRNNQHDEVVGSGTPVMLLAWMNPRAVDREGVPSAPKSCRRPRRPGGRRGDLEVIQNLVTNAYNRLTARAP